MASTSPDNKISNQNTTNQVQPQAQNVQASNVTNSNSGLIKFILTFQTLLIIALAGGLAFVSYKLYTSSTTNSVTDQKDTSKVEEKTEDKDTDSEKDTNNTSSTTNSNTSTNDSSSSSDTVSIPDGWQPVENARQGYTAYRPSSWYYRYFGSNFETLGLDPSPIPQASEYSGMITINVNSVSLDEAINNATNQLESGYSRTTQTINGRSWTIIEGTIKGDYMFIGGQKRKSAFASINGKTFDVTIIAEESTYNSNLNVYENVLRTLTIH